MNEKHDWLLVAVIFVLTVIVPTITTLFANEYLNTTATILLGLSSLLACQGFQVKFLKDEFCEH